MTPRSLLARAGIGGLALTIAVQPATAQEPAATPPAGAPDVPTPAVTEVIAVLPVEVRGAVAEHVPRSLEGRLTAGLRRGDFTVVTADDVRARVPAGECAAACLQTIAADTGAAYAVRTLVVVEGRDYRVEVVLVRSATGEPVTTSSEHCEICGHEELGDLVGDLAATLRHKLSAAVEPPRLRVRARPHGSVVTVDGEVVGVTPLDVAVAAGAHDVVVHKPGFISQRRRLAFVDGVVETITDELAPVPVEQPRVDVRARAPRLAPPGWASIGVGLGATASGVALVALDERPILSDCSGGNIDGDGDCKWRRDTLAGGLALTIAGVAAIAIGTALVALDRQRGKQTRVQPSAWVRGAGLGVRF